MSNEQKENKMQLSLNRKHEGYHQKKVGNIEIIVSKCSKGWEGTITDDEQDNENWVVYKVFGETKKQVSNMIVRELIK